MHTAKVKRHKQNGEVINEQEIEIPAMWEDLTLEQFIRIIETKKMDAIEMMSIVTGFSREYCYNIPEQAIEGVISKLYFFTQSPPDFSKWKMPNEVYINDTWCKVPTDLKKESWGQKVMAQQEINSMIEGKMNTYAPIPYLLSVYLYSTATGDKEYTEEKIRAFIPTIMRMKITDALPIGTFFLSSCLPSLKWSQKVYLRNQLRSRFRQELKTLISSE
jgi:hypothetical protein